MFVSRDEVSVGGGRFWGNNVSVETQLDPWRLHLSVTQFPAHAWSSPVVSTGKTRNNTDLRVRGVTVGENQEAWDPLKPHISL